MTADPRDIAPQLIGSPLQDAADPDNPHPIATPPTMIGAPLRDAAVDPRESDHLPPSNAGVEGEQGNPHGPHVIAPGIG